MHLKTTYIVQAKIQMLVMTMLLNVMPYQAFSSNPEASDEDFIRASLVIAQPGGHLYSRVGHAFFRMQSSRHHLDYCFSYESEDASKKVLSYLAGKLKMGMVAVPTEDLLQTYTAEHRGLTEYELNLSFPQKQRLWELLDHKLEEGMNLPYDYMARGCAYSCAKLINEVLPSGVMSACEEWPAHFNLSRRELVYRQLHDYPWTAFLLFHLVGTEADAEVSLVDKIVTPEDLRLVLQQTTNISGRLLLDKRGIELVPDSPEKEPNSLFTPLALSLLILLITVVSILIGNRFHQYLVYIIQTVIGLFMFYLIVISSLPCTGWNCLFIPFNPLPLLLWRWRRYWLIPFSAVLLIWCCVMWVSPHQMVHPAHYVLVSCIILTYLNQYKQLCKRKNYIQNKQR